MEYLEFILAILVVILSILTTVFGSKFKLKNDALSDAESWNLLSSKIIPDAVLQTESLGLLGSSVKKSFCLSLVMVGCQNNNINYADYAHQIDVEIEKIINISNNVNV